VHCPSLDAPLAFVVAPLGQRLQGRTGSLRLPPVENQPWSHIAQLDPPLPGEQATPARWEVGAWEGVRKESKWLGCGGVSGTKPSRYR
jgi:hypothetical protein